MSGFKPTWPVHVQLHLKHNEHAGMQLADYITQGHCRDYYEDDDWVSPEQKAKALETNEMWTLHWYPRTTVGFSVLHAADLDALLAKANEE